MKKSRHKHERVDKYGKYSEIKERYSSKWRKINLLIPTNFRMLCAILGVRPEDVLRDFIWAVSYASLDGAKEKQRKAARKFFLLSKFGQPLYSKKQVNRMFGELKAVREIYDTTDEMEGNDKELFWKNHHMYTQYWFKRWFEKNRRQENLSVLDNY